MMTTENGKPEKLLMRRASFLLILSVLCLTQALAQSQQEIYNSQVKSERQSENGLSAATIFPEGFTYFNRETATTKATKGSGSFFPNIYHATLMELPQMEGITIRGLSFFTTAIDPYGRIFIASRKATAPQGEYTFEVIEKVETKKGLNTALFSTPAKTTDDKVYAIGYECLATGEKDAQGKMPESWFPIRFIRDKASFPQASMICSVAKEKGRNVNEVGSRKVFVNGASLNWGNVAIVANVDAPRDKLANMAVFLPSLDLGAFFLVPSIPSPETNYKLPIINLGLSSISKLAVKAEFSDGSSETKEYTINLKPTDIGLLEYNLTKKGRGKISFKLGKVNAQNNSYPTDSMTTREINFALYPEGESVLRDKLLIEHFTTEASTASVTVEPVLKEAYDKLKKQGKECVVVAHHVGFQEDFLTLPASKELLPYFTAPSSASFAPAIAICRTADPLLGLYASTMVNTLLFPNKVKNVLGMLETVASFPSEVILTSIKQLKNTDKTRSIVVEGKDLSGMLAGGKELFLSIYRTEDSIQAKEQKGADGNPIKGYIHNNVIRELLTPIFGTPIETWSGKEFKVKIDGIRLPSNMNTEKSRLVVFLHRDIRSQDPGMRFVYAASTLGINENLGSREVIPEKRPIAFAHEGCIKVVGAYDSFVAYDTEGRIVAIDSSTVLPAGIYIVKTRLGEINYVSKVSVKE